MILGGTPSAHQKHGDSDDWLNRSLAKEVHDSVTKIRSARTPIATPSSLDPTRASGFPSAMRQRYTHDGKLSDDQDEDDDNPVRDLFSNLAAPPPSFAGVGLGKGFANLGVNLPRVAGLSGRPGSNAMSLQELIARRGTGGEQNTGAIFSPSPSKSEMEVDPSPPRSGGKFKNEKSRSTSVSDSRSLSDAPSPLDKLAVAAETRVGKVGNSAGKSPRKRSVGFSKSLQKSATAKSPAKRLGDSDSDDDGNKLADVRAGKKTPKPGRPKGSGGLRGEAAKLLAHAARLVGNADGGRKRKSTGRKEQRDASNDDSSESDSAPAVTPAALTSGRSGRQRRPPSAYWMGSVNGQETRVSGGTPGTPGGSRTAQPKPKTVGRTSGLKPKGKKTSVVKKSKMAQSSDSDATSNSDSDNDSEDLPVRGLERLDKRNAQIDSGDGISSDSDSDSDSLPLSKRKRNTELPLKHATVVASSDSDSESDSDDDVLFGGAESDAIDTDTEDEDSDSSPVRKSPKAPKPLGRTPTSVGKAAKVLSERKVAAAKSVKSPKSLPATSPKRKAEDISAKDTPSTEPPAKKKRGRPPGSTKNKGGGVTDTTPKPRKDPNAPKGKRGGFRANAGRPKGAFGKKNRELIDQGLAPEPTGPASGKKPRKQKRPKTKAEMEREAASGGVLHLSSADKAAAKKALAKKGPKKRAAAEAAKEEAEKARQEARQNASPPPKVRPWDRAIGSTVTALNLTPSPSPGRRVSPRAKGTAAALGETTSPLPGSSDGKKKDAISRQRERERRWETSRLNTTGKTQVDDFDDDFAVFDFESTPVKGVATSGLDKVVGMAIGE